MQSPSLFDDVYDSDISLNYSEYERARLLEYCIRCEIDVKEAMETPELANALMQTIADMINSTGNIDSLFKSAPATKNEDLSAAAKLLSVHLFPADESDNYPQSVFLPRVKKPIIQRQRFRRIFKKCHCFGFQ